MFERLKIRSIFFEFLPSWICCVTNVIVIHRIKGNRLWLNSIRIWINFTVFVYSSIQKKTSLYAGICGRFPYTLHCIDWTKKESVRRWLINIDHLEIGQGIESYSPRSIVTLFRYSVTMIVHWIPVLPLYWLIWL